MFVSEHREVECSKYLPQCRIMVHVIAPESYVLNVTAVWLGLGKDWNM